MFWALAILGIIILSFRFPKFGIAMLVMVALCGLFIFGYIEHQNGQEEAAKHLVRPDQLDFMDMRMGPGSYGSSYVLTGRIKNNSSYEVTSVRLKLDVQDCAPDGHCNTVGEEDETIDPAIPPGQVRDISQNAYFSDMRIQGTYKWNYSVEEIDASVPR